MHSPMRMSRSLRAAVVALLLLAPLVLATVAYARGGQDADDCPAGSTDPDCKTAGDPPPKAK